MYIIYTYSHINVSLLMLKFPMISRSLGRFSPTSFRKRGRFLMSDVIFMLVEGGYNPKYSIIGKLDFTNFVHKQMKY